MRVIELLYCIMNLKCHIIFINVDKWMYYMHHEKKTL